MPMEKFLTIEVDLRGGLPDPPRPSDVDVPLHDSRADRVTLIVFFAVFFVLFFGILLPVGRPFGESDARRDLAAGRLVLKYPMEGLPTVNGELQERLRADYGITMVARAPGHAVDSFYQTYDDAYNRLMRGRDHPATRPRCRGRRGHRVFRQN